MIIIKHMDKNKIKLPKVYKAVCTCGCEFYIAEPEFTSAERCINGAKYVSCPECGNRLSSKDMEEVSYDEYKELLDKADEMKL